MIPLLLIYLNIVQAKQAQHTSDSPEESHQMQPNSDTCHFVFCISNPIALKVSILMNEEMQSHTQTFCSCPGEAAVLDSCQHGFGNLGEALVSHIKL